MENQQNQYAEPIQIQPEIIEESGPLTSANQEEEQNKAHAQIRQNTPKIHQNIKEIHKKCAKIRQKSKIRQRRQE